MFRLPLRMRRMYVASIRLDFTKNEWNAQNAIDHARKRWLSWRLQSRVELAGNEDNYSVAAVV